MRPEMANFINNYASYFLIALLIFIIYQALKEKKGGENGTDTKAVQEGDTSVHQV